MKWKSKIVLLVCAALLAGCMNMPTKSSQITGAHVSEGEYMDMKCDRLSKELNDLRRRETQLASAQDQRRGTSQVQAFWWGFGQGDGIEASELANVRGHINAAQKAMSLKNCD